MAITVHDRAQGKDRRFSIGASDEARTVGRASSPPGPEDRRRNLTLGGLILLCALAMIALVLALFDWNLLRGPISRYASARLNRPVAIEGDLKVHLLTRTPTVRVQGLRIGNPAWAPKGDTARLLNLTVKARLWPLLVGRLELPLVQADRPVVDLLRDAQGRATWDLGPRDPKAPPLKLPPIQTILINGGHLKIVDQPRRLTFEGTVDAREGQATGGAPGFRFVGRGELNARPFLATISGAPLLNVRADRPYPFNADITAGATHVVANGQFPKPFDFGRIGAAFTIRGRDLNQLYDLTGLVLPNTPPYSASGRLTRTGPLYQVADLTGRIGRSDIAGDVKLETGRERPRLSGALRSRALDFRDLAAVFGSPMARPDPTPAEQAAAASLRGQGRILPDASLQAERLRSMDADVRYRAQSVKAAGGLPLSGVDVGVKLDAGLLKLDPIDVSFAQGRLTGVARIDARRATPVSQVDLRLANVQIAQFLPSSAGAPPLTGQLVARARLTGAGDTVHKAADRASGTVTMVMPAGQVRQLFAELMGIDATKSLFLYLAKDNSPTPVRCAVANFNVVDGVMRADRIVFDTGVVLVTGSGTVDLGRETYDLAFKGKPKKFRLVRIKAPITVKGSLRAPKFGVDAGGAVAQAGIGAVLGSVLSPLAAVLPFVDPGLGKDANCAALIGEARAEGGVAVKTPPPPAPKGKGKG